MNHAWLYFHLPKEWRGYRTGGSNVSEPARRTSQGSGEILWSHDRTTWDSVLKWKEPTSHTRTLIWGGLVNVMFDVWRGKGTITVTTISNPSKFPLSLFSPVKWKISKWSLLWVVRSENGLNLKEMNELKPEISAVKSPPGSWVCRSHDTIGSGQWADAGGGIAKRSPICRKFPVKQQLDHYQSLCLIWYLKGSPLLLGADKVMLRQR